jgi:cytochrome c
VIGTKEKITTSITEPGNYTAELTVSDAHGGSAKTGVSLVVGNHAPEVRFFSPPDGTFFTLGKPVHYEIAVTDAEDGSSADKPDELGYRTLVNAEWESTRGASSVETGLALMKQNDCFNCHSVDQKLIGPPLLEVANRYRGKPEAVAPSVERVLRGSSGVWGEVGMLPHPQVNLDEANLMVRWIFSLEPGETAPAVNRGLKGELTVPDDPKLTGCVIDAAYTDAGKGLVGSIGTTASVRLLPRHLQAETGKVADARLLGGSGSEDRFVGAINHGSTVSFGKVQLSDTASVTARASSGGQGGTIELHDGSPGGPLVAKIEAPPTGAWDQWKEFNAPLQIKGPVDLVVVFVNPGKGGLMNLDWLQFNP